MLLGAPSSLAGRGGPPGRGAWLAAGDPVECQVLLPDAGPPPSASADAAPGPLRVLPLPDVVRLGDLGPPPAGSGVPVGAGGDAGAPLALDLARGALVVGTPRSGRTTTLRTLARGLAAQGRSVAVVARDPALRGEARRAPACAPTPDGVRAVLEQLDRRVRRDDGGTGHPPVVVVDDADALAQALPLEAERLAQLAADGTTVVVAACSTTAALLAHRGLLAHLRAGRTGVLLDPGERGADEALASPLEDVVEPGVRRPGRGALVVDGVATPLQVALP